MKKLLIICLIVICAPDLLMAQIEEKGSFNGVPNYVFYENVLVSSKFVITEYENSIKNDFIVSRNNSKWSQTLLPNGYTWNKEVGIKITDDTVAIKNTDGKEVKLAFLDSLIWHDLDVKKNGTIFFSALTVGSFGKYFLSINSFGSELIKLNSFEFEIDETFGFISQQLENGFFVCITKQTRFESYFISNIGSMTTLSSIKRLPEERILVDRKTKKQLFLKTFIQSKDPRFYAFIAEDLSLNEIKFGNKISSANIDSNGLFFFVEGAKHNQLRQIDLKTQKVTKLLTDSIYEHWTPDVLNAVSDDIMRYGDLLYFRSSNGLLCVDLKNKLEPKLILDELGGINLGKIVYWHPKAPMVFEQNNDSLFLFDINLKKILKARMPKNKSIYLVKWYEDVIDSFYVIGNPLSGKSISIYEKDKETNLENDNLTPVCNTYPNPTKGYLTIESNHEIASVNLLNLNRQAVTIDSDKIDAHICTIRPTKTISGLFVLIVEYKNGYIENKMIVFK